MNWVAFGFTFCVVFIALSAIVGFLFLLTEVSNWLERFSPLASILIVLAGIALLFALGVGVTG